MKRNLVIDTEVFFAYNVDIALFKFPSPCTFLYPFGYMLNEVGQKGCESSFVKNHSLDGASFIFPCFKHAGRKTTLAQKLEEKTVQVFSVQKKLIGFGNAIVKAYNYVGLFCVVPKEQICSFS
ncbi:hypothetical protein [Robertmurraya massiliosenegalensis]|uniref:hypothetical protein n=1 Tax=Robertmurraya massiliosenegalensis TaxID=1287657 RepID=UPI00037EA6F3|nr:hypothetical protein [Robertmurraya massiliosenegalensis]